MIVWVASFPRSGNTFLRIVLKQLYGLRTSVVYDVDGVAERLGADLVGFVERDAPIEAMRDSDEFHFVKTHRQRDDQVQEADRAICLVRDGRDALVSWARLLTETDESRFEQELQTLMNRNDRTGTGSWGTNVLSWLRPPAPHRVLLRYEELARDPRSTIAATLTALMPQLPPQTAGQIPSFADLQRTDIRFFRRGHTGSHQDELPGHMHDLFWSWPDNASAMKLLGYTTMR